MKPRPSLISSLLVEAIELVDRSLKIPSGWTTVVESEVVKEEGLVEEEVVAEVVVGVVEEVVVIEVVVIEEVVACEGGRSRQ